MTKLFLAIILLFAACKFSKRKDVASIVEKAYYSSGELKSIKEYSKSDRSYWKLISFFKNGDTSSIANHHDGNFIGKATFFYKEGRKNFEETYDSLGRSNGIFYLWYETGQIKQSGKKEDGKMNGEWKTYYENGKVESTVFFDNNKKNGWRLTYSSGGDTLRKEFYQADSLIR